MKKNRLHACLTEGAACFFVFWLRDREGLTASAVQNRV